MSLLKVNEVQNYNGSSLTLTASTVSTSAQLNTGGNISVTGSINVSDDSTTRSNLGLGSIATQNANAVAITGGSLTGTEIDLKSSGTTIYKSDGATAILSESSGTATLANVNLSSSVGHGYTTILQKDFTLSNGTNTQLNYTSGEIIDELGWHSTSTNTDRITVDRDGIYLVTLNCFDIDAINRAFFTVNHYSSSASLLETISEDITTDTDAIDDLSLSGVFKMDANSFAQCVAYQLSGSNRTAKFTFTLTLIKEL